MTLLELLADPSAWVAFATLSMLEIVLGIDNIVFISILPMVIEFVRHRRHTHAH